MEVRDIKVYDYLKQHMILRTLNVEEQIEAKFGLLLYQLPLNPENDSLQSMFDFIYVVRGRINCQHRVSKDDWAALETSERTKYNYTSNITAKSRGK